jgi:hypothetical protein
MPRKKMYACFAFFPNGEVKRWKYVRDLKSFAVFLNKDHPLWKYFNVYDKGTRQYIKRFYPDNIIPKVLGLILILGLSLLTQKFTFDKTFIQFSFLSYEKTFRKTTFINGFNNSATIPTLIKEKRSVVC